MKSLVKNAADPTQVKAADNRILNGRDRELSDLKFILSLPEGKRFVWRLLAHCKTFESVWEPSARIHYLAGVQDVGHFLMAEISEADESALIGMMQEKLKKEKELL